LYVALYNSVAVIDTATNTLGGHLKTGHRWPLQNRPTKLSQNKSIYTAPEVVAAIYLTECGALGLYWRHLGGGYGNAGMRPERRPRGRDSGRASLHSSSLS
jgi:hypothetical protein